MKMVYISEFIGSVSAVSPVKALELYDKIIKEHLLSGKKIHLSFKGIEDCSTAFCNASIGKAYIEFGKEKVDSLMFFEDYGTDNQWLSKIEKAKALATQASLREATDKALEELIKF